MMAYLQNQVTEVVVDHQLLESSCQVNRCLAHPNRSCTPQLPKCPLLRTIRDP